MRLIITITSNIELRTLSDSKVTVWYKNTGWDDFQPITDKKNFTIKRKINKRAVYGWEVIEGIYRFKPAYLSRLTIIDPILDRLDEALHEEN